jgi:hypothetical protein
MHQYKCNECPSCGYGVGIGWNPPPPNPTKQYADKVLSDAERGKLDG